MDNPNRPITRHSWSSTQILRQWYLSNVAWPYPSAAEKEELSRRTGLSVRQISQWFVNTRRRDSERQPSEIPGSGNKLILGSLPTKFDPKPEQPDMVEAIGHQYLSSSEGGSSSLDPFSQATAQYNDTQDDVLVSSSAASSGCPYSHDSDHTNRRHRKNRRIGLRHTATDSPAEEKRLRLYQCTFCTDTFKSRYDWTRHEGTLHIALERWICLPTGPKRWDLGDETPKCSLCDLCDPTDAHFESHHIADCVSKPVSLRTFHRRDHLYQHLRLSHGVEKMIPSMISWRSKMSEVKSRCGFCGETFSLWSDRNDHLVDHFRRGKSMKDWKGDRGLEPSVAMLVQSAMPPYLIGTEAGDLELFIASKGVLKKALVSPERPNPPNIFELLTARLGDFVTFARYNGDEINCDILRRQARIILYGDNDPVKQTPADNDQWLTLFKVGHGLPSDRIQQQIEPSLVDEAFAMASNPLMATSMLSNTDNSTPLREDVENELGSMVTINRMYDEVGFKLPWWCQTPECLAELMQMSQEFSLTSLGNIDIDDASAGNPQH